MFRTGEIVPVPHGDVVLFQLKYGTVEPKSQIGTFDFRQDLSGSNLVSSWTKFINWFYGPTLYLRDSGEFEPGRTPVSRNSSSGFVHLVDCSVGVDEICKHLENDPILNAHAEWVQELERPYDRSLVRIASEHQFRRIV